MCGDSKTPTQVAHDLRRQVADPASPLRHYTRHYTRLAVLLEVIDDVSQLSTFDKDRTPFEPSQAVTVQKQAVKVSGTLVYEPTSGVRRMIENQSVLPSVVTSTKPPLTLLSQDLFKGAPDRPPLVQMAVLNPRDSPHHRHTHTITKPCNTSIYGAHEVPITRAAIVSNTQQDYNILIYDGDQRYSDAPAVSQWTPQVPRRYSSWVDSYRHA